jgi:hypothetical protein
LTIGGGICQRPAELLQREVAVAERALESVIALACGREVSEQWVRGCIYICDVRV